MTEEEAKQHREDRAKETATDEETKYISSPKKNYKWWIAAVTVAIIAVAAWYFYKH